ncbi:MAG: all-trans-8'-apo-beta-carotenal 15 [Geobacteraceae bacterium]|nr:MAG: all-trans-8'-apo-beta-carotenal 15 [Geobacteraceae bacterium]
MLTRRDFIKLCGGAGMALSLPGCAVSPPLRKDVFPDFGLPDHTYLGLATSLREENDYEARVEGMIPAGLRGTLYRNGPGLFDRNGLRKRNLLDGDGMVQAFTMHDTGVRYRNRFVRTRKYQEEAAAGRFIYPSWSTQAPGGLWANFWAADRVKCQAGVTVYLRNGRLYAFDDTGLPYVLDPATLETAGESRLGLPDGFSVYSAHSKIDPRTGEWLHFGVRYGPDPMLHITIFAKDGGLKSHRLFPVPRYVYMHDWFVSDRHLIFQFHPAEIAFWGFLLGIRSMADSLRWRPEKGNLMMVLERERDAAPLFLHTDACYMWHSVNAYEKGREIVADFVGYENPDHFIGPDPVAAAVMAGRRGEYIFPGELRRYLIDPARKAVRQETLDRGSYEWPRVNELHRCHGYRFGYLAKCRPGEFFWSFITRVDMGTGRTESYDFGEGVYCTEPVFAPKPGFRFEPDAPHEPGWLLTEGYDSRTRKSFLAVLEAERVADGPVAVIHLTHHVPFSYHGFWQANAAV